MSREIDVRDFTKSRSTPERTEQMQMAAAAVSERLPGSHTVTVGRMNPATGNPAALFSAAAPTEKGNYIQRALQHVQTVGPALGMTATQAPEFVADPVVQQTSTGAHAVNLQQRYRGIPIFEGATMVRFAPDGSVEGTAGSAVSVPGDIPMTRNLSVQDAVLNAARFVTTVDPATPPEKDQFGQVIPPVKIDLTGFKPEVIAAFTNTPEQSAVLKQGPFGDEIKASLTWFPMNDSLTLGWSVLLTLPEYVEQYHVIVDANSGAILYSKQKVQYVAAVGNVYHLDGGSPRQMTNFPLNVGAYSLPTPTVGQNNWRWCHKCQGLYFAGSPTQGVCPAGGTHDHTGSGDYLLVQNNTAYLGQDNWRWCHKCQGLYFAGHATQGHCSAGGPHDHTGSGDYVLLNQQPLAPGQHGWRWCHKCEGLYFSLNATQGSCPAAGAHDSTGSGDYSLLAAGTNLPAAFPDTWVSQTKTIGNSTNAHLNAAGNPLTGSMVNNVLTFNPTDPVGDDQKVLNIFYYCCYMHDFSYLLGFREADGNFQVDDLGRGGVGNDSVNAQSFSGAVSGTANMSTPVDGSSPTMHMGLLTSTNRHTAFDASVVFHEFTHGISNRLVGGPMNSNALDAPQPHGMGEGWSDYFACTINNKTVVGDWLVNSPKGIRGFPYDANFPDGFGKLGTGRYAANPQSGQPLDEHNVGEIWCAILMEVGRRTDRFFAIQMVMDAFKLTAANPSFLDARDAISLALSHRLSAGIINTNQFQGAWQGMWSAFARFGMGPAAHSNGAQLNGIVADITLGQDNWTWCKKCQGLFFNGHPTKGKCPAGGAHDGSASADYHIPNNWAAAPGQDKWRWCHKCEAMYFSGNNQGVCAAGGTHDQTGSGNYKLIFNAWGSPGQYNWRWCKKCQALYFNGNPTSTCPAGGMHDGSASGDYSLVHTKAVGNPMSLTEELGLASAAD
jgi:Fungalysin metallopeptidase (M36)/Fungalysin/Thermolysin Propeptide Motif